MQKSGKNFEYVNVLSDPLKLEEMLKHSDGMRRVPIIVENGKVIVGFNGRA
ncbi:MAG: hypothetical protein HC887_03455 [Desulfobacteraceae bacterium]|nr:hypothetical protein [Desulfobacteraceae bacterium]